MHLTNSYFNNVQVYPHVLASLPTWLFTILVILVALLPDIVIRYKIVNKNDFVSKLNKIVSGF